MYRRLYIPGIQFISAMLGTRFNCEESSGSPISSRPILVCMLEVGTSLRLPSTASLS